MHKQLVMFPDFFAPLPFDDLPPLAKKLAIYFKAFHREIFVGEAYLAKKFDVCVRTIQRMLDCLRDAGWVNWKRRGKKGYRTNLYTLHLHRDVASNVASELPASFNTIKNPEEHTPRASYASWKGVATVKPDKAFDAYIEVFIAAGKPLNDGDIARARREWGNLSIEERLCAGRDVVPLCVQTQTPFIPHPANHLRNKPWTRVAIERSLPYRPSLEESKIGRCLSNAWKLLHGDES